MEKEKIAASRDQYFRARVRPGETLLTHAAILPIGELGLGSFDGLGGEVGERGNFFLGFRWRVVKPQLFAFLVGESFAVRRPLNGSGTPARRRRRNGIDGHRFLLGKSAGKGKNEGQNQAGGRHSAIVALAHFEDAEGEA